MSHDFDCSKGMFGAVTFKWHASANATLLCGCLWIENFPFNRPEIIVFVVERPEIVVAMDNNTEKVRI